MIPYTYVCVCVCVCACVCVSVSMWFSKNKDLSSCSSKVFSPKLCICASFTLCLLLITERILDKGHMVLVLTAKSLTEVSTNKQLFSRCLVTRKYAVDTICCHIRWIIRVANDSNFVLCVWVDIFPSPLLLLFYFNQVFTDL